MNVQNLKEHLERCDPNSPVMLASYDGKGKTIRQELTVACNYEYQQKARQVWLVVSDCGLREVD